MSKPRFSVVSKKSQFIALMLVEGGKVGQLYQAAGISRSTAYLWWQEFCRGGSAGLEEKRRGPAPGKGRWQAWRSKVLALRRHHPSWGPRKLQARLRRLFPRVALPSVRTIARQLHAAGCARVRRRPRQPGARLARPALTGARWSNAVWTIDFKGSFCTGDGRRCQPLTVRDLYSRYLLVVEHVPSLHVAVLQRVLRRCFRRYGVPRVLRVDNGKPFGGEGPRGLTAFSVWWTRLGIRVEFIRPGCPQENGAHEQMHGVLKDETARPPAANLAAQAHRFRRFQKVYNEVRPHEGRRLRPPGHSYRPQPAPLPRLQPLTYPKNWLRRKVSQGGLVFWGGRMRMIGRGFRHEYVGLKPLGGLLRGAAVEVYLGKLLLGELHAQDRATIRPVRWSTKKGST